MEALNFTHNCLNSNHSLNGSNDHMPNTQRNSNDIIERSLSQDILQIEDVYEADAISLFGPIIDGVDDEVRDAIETKVESAPSREKIVVVLTTRGGSIGIVDRMVDTLRKHYEIVDFIIPNFAYSAGTVFVMAGDAIHMDYYSRLGPIDPQIFVEKVKKMVPALGYLERYNELMTKADSGNINVAEIQLLLDFDQAELYQYVQHRELSIELLKKWLCKYKFKNWNTTETRKKKVTQDMKLNRAEQIATTLNNTEKWHSHNYGISMEELENELKLKIDDFGKVPNQLSAIRSYDNLLSDYMQRLGLIGVVHIAGRFKPYI